MTSPTEPAAPFPLPAPAPPGPPPAPAPPAPAPPAPPAPPDPPAPPNGDPGDELRATLERERAKTREAERQLAQLRAASMTEQERAVAAARDEGRKEAARAAGVAVAGAEFRALAAGKLADPGKMLEDGDLNLARFVDDAGEVDKRALGRMVDRLVASAAPVANPGTIPGGPRGGAPSDGDFLRQAMSHHPRV